MASPYLKDKNMTAYDFWPLEGDPTHEERARIDQEQIEKEMEAAHKRREQILIDFKKRNART
jgi:hypothetical protein